MDLTAGAPKHDGEDGDDNRADTGTMGADRVRAGILSTATRRTIGPANRWRFPPAGTALRSARPLPTMRGCGRLDAIGMKAPGGTSRRTSTRRQLRSRRTGASMRWALGGVRRRARATSRRARSWLRENEADVVRRSVPGRGRSLSGLVAGRRHPGGVDILLLIKTLDASICLLLKASSSVIVSNVPRSQG